MPRGRLQNSAFRGGGGSVTMSLTLTIDGKPITCESGQTVLDVCRANGVELPTLCYLEGLTTVGACRLCLVEIEGSSKLFPACATPVALNMKIKTDTERLKEYRRMTMELFFAERNHVCSVCVANGACEMQNVAYSVGMTKVRFPYLFQKCEMDGSHKIYSLDHNRCILCTRCVRVCDEVEGAHNWDVMGRGYATRVIADFNQPWNESETCTDCGKCVDVCPVGALWHKGSVQGKMVKEPSFISQLISKRKAHKN